MLTKFKIILLTFVMFKAVSILAFADGSAANSPAPAPDTKAVQDKTNLTAGVTDAKKLAKPTQADVASTTAAFGKAAKTDESYKSAVDAHALEEALKLVDKNGAFRGTVAKVFEPRGLAIVEFDDNYKTALTAILKGQNFTIFPALTNLIGKEVLVTGKFIKFRDAAEIVLEKPEQVKIVE